MKEWWDKIMNKRFHIGWVFLVLGIGLALSITLLYKTIT